MIGAFVLLGVLAGVGWVMRLCAAAGRSVELDRAVRPCGEQRCGESAEQLEVDA